MTEQNSKAWKVLRIAGPFAMFVIVLFVCLQILNIELVLAVVLAWLFAIIDFFALKWVMSRKTARHEVPRE